ncbi:hypothetical protein Q1695_004641 [Nippostrongylus brasiliensis]|nr:hypothetical protein Q1695_004641 [Nippostrongylus brasiliensis]
MGSILVVIISCIKLLSVWIGVTLASDALLVIDVSSDVIVVFIYVSNLIDHCDRYMTRDVSALRDRLNSLIVAASSSGCGCALVSSVSRYHSITSSPCKALSYR